MAKSNTLSAWRLITSLPTLFDELQREGFREVNSPRLQLRATALLSHITGEDSLKYSLAALICHSEEEQRKFYQVFEAFVARHQPTEGKALPKPKRNEKAPDITATDAPSSIPPPPTGNILPGGRGEHLPDLAPTARSGPITVELRFRDDGFRPWNLPELEPALRPLREKEWSEAQEWDIPISIRKTMRGGGVPHFVRKQKRTAPQYLFLILQKSVRDHLAAFYADLVKEMLRRDIDADFYFFGDVPIRCWRDRRLPSTYTTLDRLYSAHKNSRLILIGEPDGLLDAPRFYPSPLAFQLREEWRDVALLNTRSTALWGKAEETLCRLFPVAPANIRGLESLFGQWQSRQSFTPTYWKTTCPESIPTNLQPSGDSAEWETKTLKSLQIYLGKFGFVWLCAISVYPEIYWQMTKILHDEAISNDDVPKETQRNRIWHTALLDMSRLEWLRRGSIPSKFRKQLREMLPNQNAIVVRKELLEIMDWDKKNAKLDESSYAYQNREFTLVQLDYEAKIKMPKLTEIDRAALDADLRERIKLAGVKLSDIADAVGREIFREIQAKPIQKREPGFWVLWIDDRLETDAGFQLELTKEMSVHFVNATDTTSALEALEKQDFDLIVSDLERGNDLRGGVDTMKTLREKRVQTQAVIFTRSAHAESFIEELASLGVKDILRGRDAQRDLIGRLVAEKQQGNTRSSSSEVFMTAFAKVAKSVCRVVLADGNLGTGFLVLDGYLFTCNHVIVSPEDAGLARIEFNFERGEDGKNSSIVSYRLDPSDFRSSPPRELNFTRVKVIDDSSAPLSQWGFIEVESEAIPSVGEKLSLVHHPEGKEKKTEINTLEVLGQLKDNLFYTPLTRPGSSGAPILNKDLRVVAIHRVRKSEMEGGLVINTQGEKKGASEGVMMGSILSFIHMADRVKADQASDSADALEEANMHYEQAQKSLDKKDYPIAIEEFETAWGQYIPLALEDKQADALLGLGKAIQGTSNFQGSLPHLDNAQKLYEKLSNKSGQSASLHALTTAYLNLRDYDRARDTLRQTLKIDELLGSVGLTYHELGEVNEQKGDLEQAEDCYQKALKALEEETKDFRTLANTQEALGRLAMQRNDYEKAKKYYLQTLDSVKEIDSRKEANALANLAQIEFLHNNQVQAVQYAEQARSLFFSDNDKENGARMERLLEEIKKGAEERANVAAKQSKKAPNINPITDKDKERIQELISLGKTEEALDLLKEFTKDAVLLQSRFKGAKKQFDMGMIDFSEWSRMQAQINYGLLEMMNTIKADQLFKQTRWAETSSKKDLHRVFISYLQKDQFAMRAVKNYLENNGLKVLVDEQDTAAGEDHYDFFQKMIQESAFILSIISEDSLKSSWVNKETTIAMTMDMSGAFKWIPVRLGGKFFEEGFLSESLNEVDTKIETLKKEIKKLLDLSANIDSFSTELSRMQDLKTNLPDVLQKLKAVYVPDISGKLFDIEMDKVVKFINGNIEDSSRSKSA